MLRIARIDTPGLLHHVMIRGIERRKIFNDDKDRENFIERLSILLIKGIYADNEQTTEATIRRYRIVQTEGKRKVTRLVDFYNLA